MNEIWRLTWALDGLGNEKSFSQYRGPGAATWTETKEDSGWRQKVYYVVFQINGSCRNFWLLLRRPYSERGRASDWPPLSSALSIIIHFFTFSMHHTLILLVALTNDHVPSMSLWRRECIPDLMNHLNGERFAIRLPWTVPALDLPFHKSSDDFRLQLLWF